MTYQTLLMIMAVGILFMAWYANSSKRNKILCTFRRVNKTKISRFVKMQSRYVIFDGHKYDIVPDRITFLWYTSGFVHMLFPQWVATLDYTDGKRLPLNTNRMDYDWDNPENRNTINIAELIKSYFATSNPSTKASKLGFLQQWLPWIAILLVVIVAFYFNSKMSGFGATLDTVVNKINQLSK